ncbi:hypothetical protein KSC_017260 [Ktedonobacter sp. SOSP1-52]|nr:hypothetical protein KSC_017260 [Ktedonobacter sp. SOSP1-52]
MVLLFNKSYGTSRQRRCRDNNTFRGFELIPSIRQFSKDTNLNFIVPFMLFGLPNRHKLTMNGTSFHRNDINPIIF